MTRHLPNIAKWLAILFWRGTLFAIPVAFVAQWCEVEPTWKAVGFVAFCLVWSDIVDGWTGDKSDEPKSAGQRAAAVPLKPARQRVPAEILTPAQVAAEAQKLTPRPLRQA